MPPQSDPLPASEAEAGGARRWVLSAYFAEGLPFSLIHQVSSQVLTSWGARLEDIGLTALLGVPGNLKFLWAPLVQARGQLRSWIVITQLGLAGCSIGLAALCTGRPVYAFCAALMLMAIFTATHDIAVDGAYVSVLDERAQSRWSGLRIAAYRVALIFGGGGRVALAGQTSWTLAFLVAALVFAAAALWHLRKVPDSEQTLPGGGLRYVESFKSLLAQPSAGWVLAFVLLFRAGDVLMFAMSTPLLSSLGWGTSARGGLSALGTLMFIGGALTGGELIARAGLRRALWPLAALQSSAIPLYIVLAWARPGSLATGAIVAMEQFVSGLGTSALSVFLMHRSARRYGTTHFAALTALMNALMTVLGSVSGFLAQHLGFVAFFTLAWVASLPGVFLAFFVPTVNLAVVPLARATKAREAGSSDTERAV